MVSVLRMNPFVIASRRATFIYQTGTQFLVEQSKTVLDPRLRFQSIRFLHLGGYRTLVLVSFLECYLI